MRRFLISAACFGVMLSGGSLAAAQDAASVVPSWEKAFNAGDAAAIAAMYTSDATLFGTLSPNLTASADQLQAYFANAAKSRLQVKLVDGPTMTKLSDSAFVLAGIYEFSGTRPDGQSFSAPSRYSFVVIKDGGAWRIAHQHSSPRPRPQ